MTEVTQGLGCHAKGEMQAAARAAGKSDVLDRYAADYPQGPHDKPQSMCPAFGSLRVGISLSLPSVSDVILFDPIATDALTGSPAKGQLLRERGPA